MKTATLTQKNFQKPLLVPQNRIEWSHRVHHFLYFSFRQIFISAQEIHVENYKITTKKTYLLENDVQEVVEEHDMCVGCDDKDKKEEEKKQEDPPLNVEIVLDPETGKVRYIIKGIEIK